MAHSGARQQYITDELGPKKKKKREEAGSKHQTFCKWLVLFQVKQTEKIPKF